MDEHLPSDSASSGPLEAFFRISNAIAGSLDLEAILDGALQEVLALFGFSSGVVRLLDPPTGQLRLTTSRGLPDDLRERLGGMFRIGEGLVGLAAQRRAVVIVEDLLASEYADSPWAQGGYRAFVSAPMLNRGMLLGTLTLASREVRTFAPRDQVLLLAVANQLGLAVANGELYQAAQRKIQDLSALNQCSQDIGPAPEIDHVLRVVSERMAQLLHLERTAVFCWDRSSDFLSVEAVHGFARPFAEWREPLDGLALARSVVREGHVAVTADPVGEGLLPGRMAVEAEVGNVLAVPLMALDEPMGMLVGDRSGRAFIPDSDELDLAMIFANQAAVWISGARLFKREQEARAKAETAEDRFRDLLEMAPDAILSVNREGRIVLANQQVDRLFQYQREELIGQSIETLIPDRFRASHVAQRETYYRDPRTRPMGAGLSLLARRKDGTEFPVEISLSPNRYRDRGEEAVICVVRDITERKRAEERFRALLESAPDAMVIVNEQGRIVLVNSQMERMFGYGREELLGNEIEVLIPERVRERHVGHRTGFLRSPIPRPMGAGLELLGRRRDGTEFPVEISLSPLNTEEGVLVTGAIRDITERREVERERKRQAEDLARSNAELEQFAYVASHDLQEPLRMVASYTQLLARRYQGKLDEDADEFIGFAVDGVRRMQALINDLLAFSRVGRMGKEFTPTNFNAVLERVLFGMQTTLEESKAVVTHDPLPTLSADATQIGQLLQNLISNAVKFRKGPGPRVHIGAEQVGDEWRFAVKDDGIGIDPQYGERIFLIFQRLHNRAEYPGTGIGLAICKRIVERHGGRIWLESAEGEGTTFYFTLPASGDIRP